jgi:site-specific DNA-methyltransferase (adenine-specific)
MIIPQDCLEFLKTQSNEIYDLIICDPPYHRIWGDFDFIWKDLNQYLGWCKTWLKECHRTLKPTGSIYLWGKIGYNNGYPLFKLADWIENEKLFIVRNWITQRNTRGRGTKRGYMEAREELIFMTKSDTYTWNTAYTEEESRLYKLNQKGANDKPRTNPFKRVSDVWIDISEASQNKLERFGFPTTKALKLCERIIKASSNEGDFVYIPFGGSGSEAVACENLKRKWVLTEINQDYIKIIEKRTPPVEASGDFFI